MHVIDQESGVHLFISVCVCVCVIKYEFYVFKNMYEVYVLNEKCICFICIFLTPLFRKMLHASICLSLHSPRGYQQAGLEITHWPHK